MQNIVAVDNDKDGIADINDAFPLDALMVANGDIDDNGKVEVNDALSALRMSVGLENATVENIKFGDVAPYVSGKPAPDGQITAADALVILRKAVGLMNW